MNGGDDGGSLVAQAQALARQKNDAAEAERRRIHGERVEQVAAMLARRGPECSRQLALHLGRNPDEPPFSTLVWKLGRAADKDIDFDSENALLVNAHRLPLFVTNFEGYSVGVSHGYESGRYGFGLACGDGNWNGFTDLEDFGRVTLHAGDRAFQWSNVKLSRYSAE